MSLIELIEKENNRNIKEHDVYLNDVDQNQIIFFLKKEMVGSNL